MKKIFYLPISIFLFGLMLLLIRYFTPQLPVWLGEIGKLIVLFGQLFLPWQMWGIMIYAYLLTGIILHYQYYEYNRSYIDYPWWSWFLAAIGWPIIFTANKIYGLIQERKGRKYDRLFK